MHTQQFSIYILDFDWKYQFVNSFACETLSMEAKNLIGKNMWELFESYKQDPDFIKLKETAENKVVANITTISPITRKRISITSYPLTDCYYLADTILPSKESLMDELRAEIGKNKLQADNG